MRLVCNNCGDLREIVVEISGPHLKASCKMCGRYIKFLNQVEKDKLEREEDEKYGARKD